MESRRDRFLLSCSTALVREWEPARNDRNHSGPSSTDAIRRWPAKLGHLIQDVAREECLGHWPSRTARAKTMPDDRLLLVARLLLPPVPSDRRHLLDRTIAILRSRPTRRHGRRLGRWHDDGRVTRSHGIVAGDRVVGRGPCTNAPRRAHQRGQLRLAHAARVTKSTNLYGIVNLKLSLAV